jgi:hypothetical protein
MGGAAAVRTAALVFATTAAVAACDFGERPLNYEKGTYLGATEAPTPGATLEALRQRAELQGSGSGIVAGSGRDAGTLGAREFRSADKELRERAAHQGR